MTKKIPTFHKVMWRIWHHHSFLLFHWGCTKSLFSSWKCEFLHHKFRFWYSSMHSAQPDNVKWYFIIRVFISGILKTPEFYDTIVSNTYLRLLPAARIYMHVCVRMCSGSLIDVSTTPAAKSQDGSSNSRKMFLHKVRYTMAVQMHGITAPCNIAIWRANEN